jgi:hypothetical protein
MRRPGVNISPQSSRGMEDLIRVDQLAAPTAADGRECGSCTACCIVPAIAELQKPARWSCDHLERCGCRIYDARPASCRVFHCLWLRGAMAPNLELRPDRLGVMFDWFRSLKTSAERCVAFELWAGALATPDAVAVLNHLAAHREVDLSYRDGTWRTIGPLVTADHIPPDATDYTSESATPPGNSPK